jgi:diaminopimelate epimerase
MERLHIPFKKMNGLGNDFVVIDARSRPVQLSPALAGGIANRETGAGCDQVIILEPSPRSDVFMRIINADGSEVAACGNATRCVADLLSSESGRGTISIETRAGILSAVARGNGFVTVDMGEPRFGWQEIPLARAFEDTRAIDLTHPLPGGGFLHSPSVVNVGNPHCIFWVEDAESCDLGAIGPELEHHPLFPERANVSLAEVISKDAIKLRVWERGAGLTRACGTAACAVAVAGARLDKTGRDTEVQLPGGSLRIEWRARDGHILMTGPTELEFDGILHLDGGHPSYEVASRP